MTAPIPGREARELRRPALERASKIRAGMKTYIDTLGLVHQAWAERDDIKLGYPSWEAYYNTEFSEDRLKLSPELRDKAIRELRIAGMSQREIAVSTGLSASTVNRHLARVAGETDILDGEVVSPAKSPLVEAITGAIEDAEERTKTAGLAGPAPDEEQATTPSGTAAAGDRVDPPAAADPDPIDQVLDALAEISAETGICPACQRPLATS
jgi:hypothetical protein